MTRSDTDVGSVPVPGVWATSTRSPGRSLAATFIDIKKLPVLSVCTVVREPAPSAHSSVTVAFGANPVPPIPMDVPARTSDEAASIVGV